MAKFYSVSEASEETGVSAATIRAMLRDGLLVGFDEGNRWVLPEESVDHLLALGEEVAEADEEPEDDEAEGDEEEAEDDGEDESDE